MFHETAKPKNTVRKPEAGFITMLVLVQGFTIPLPHSFYFEYMWIAALNCSGKALPAKEAVITNSLGTGICHHDCNSQQYINFLKRCEHSFRGSIKLLSSPLAPSIDNLFKL